MKDAIWYFQDKLAKFCPADKDRPNSFEIAMFDYGKQEAQAEIESFRQKLAVAEEALGFYANNKYYEDDHPHALSGFHEDCCTIKNDYGYNAREALAKIRREG